MKRWFTLVSCLLLSVVLYACNSSKPTETTKTISKNPEEILVKKTVNTAKIKTEITGKWTMPDMGGSINSLTLNKNGTFERFIGQKPEKGTWKLAAPASLTLYDVNGNDIKSMDITLANDNNTMYWHTEEGATYRLERPNYKSLVEVKK
ncbi:MAG TPA: hypothetical protein QF753_12370 [Victivallales bacterium]|nr:hypothetical protein [Victivallales bacterium]|tara:strand:+ start:96 stop:542 length:447 start_codon:yes stop_codon:yes gene_type:complete